MIGLPSLLVLSFLLLLPFSLCVEDYYKTLGVDKSASERDIKKAYRTLSKKFHPDKNPGNDSAHQKFVDIAEAYDILSTSTTRKIYDQYGHEGLQQHKQGGGGARHDPFDLFSRFFGGGGHFGHGQRRGQDMAIRLLVPLKDFYTGNDVDFKIEKQQICDHCEGTGAADGKVETCSQCGGHGAVVRKQMLAPGFYQQVQVACDKCGGRGKSIKNPCPICKGKRVVKKQVEMSATIEKGMEKESRLVFENEADESPDWVAGDVVVTLGEQEPKLGESDAERTDGTFFRRRGKDLFWKEVLSLREAWMGDWTRNLTHLDGHIVRLGRKRGEVVQPNTVESIPGEGMPVYHHGHLSEQGPDDTGSLYVEYTVILPDQMEGGMEKDFHSIFEKWRKKNGVNLQKDSGRPIPPPRDEL
ncbi:DnaJ- protein scj1 [Myotisia sp. PD_48]|nr:DnaJ- protein scj1 [Myotisia sp. PD_48]